MINDSLDDAKHDKLCGEALENPEFVGVHTQELKLMLKEALEKGKETDQIVALLSRLKEEDQVKGAQVTRRGNNSNARMMK